MGTVEFGGEHEPLRTVNGESFILLGTLLSRCVSAGNALFPRKQRSAVKNRAKYGASLQGNDRAKRLKLNVKQRHISKDEEEVAEALYALANMFGDEVPATKSTPPLPEAGSLMVVVGGIELKESSSKERGGESSDLLNTNQEVKNEANVDPQLPSVTQASHSDASGVQNDWAVGSSRKNVSAIVMTPEGIQAASQNQASPVMASVSQNHKHYGVLKSCNFPGTEALRSESKQSTLEHTSQLHQVDCDTAYGKRNKDEAKKSLKRCATHIYVSHLVKALKLTTKEEFPENPSQQGTSGELVHRFSPLCGTTEPKHETKKDVFVHSRPVKDQPIPDISARHGLCGESDTHVGAYRGGTHNQSSKSKLKVYSSPFYGHESVLAPQLLKQPQYMSPSSRFSYRMATHAVFPHLRAESQHFWQPMNINTALPLSNANRSDPYPCFALKDGSALFHENMTHLGLPCNQRFQGQGSRAVKSQFYIQ